MKKFLLILLLVVIILVPGCSEKPEEIRLIKQNDAGTEQKEVRTELSTDTTVNDEVTDDMPERKSSGQSERVRITTSNVNSNIGKKVILKGYIASVAVREKVAYLNFDKNYPNNTCSVTIFADDFDKFGDLNRFENKNIEVSGKLTEYRGKPQIIINSPGQIKILN